MWLGCTCIQGVYTMIDSKVRNKLKAFGYQGKITINLKDLKQRYRKLSKKYHPDVTNDDKIFLEIKDYYESLLLEFEGKDGMVVDLTEPLNTVGHGEFVFSYILQGVEYRL